MKYIVRSLATGAILIALATPFIACGDDGGEEGLVECTEEHIGFGLSEVEAIAECLFDELGVSFDTQAACEQYVMDNGGFPNSITAACEMYFALKNPDAGT